MTGFSATRAVADNSAVNAYAKACQAVSGAAWSVASVAALATPETFPLTKIAEDSTAYVTNLAQKLCPPQITVPAPVKKDPDTGQCYASFHQTTTKGEYNNYFGVSPPWTAWNMGLRLQY